MDCVICLGALSQPETLPCCRNSFCGDCLRNWTEVRNCCPTCIQPIGTHSTNLLALCPPSPEFDNGSLQLDSEFSALLHRAAYLRELLAIKRQHSRNHKNFFPLAHLHFAEERMRQVEDQMDIGSLALGESDRVTATASIQMATELILEVEAVLAGESELEEWDSERS